MTELLILESVSPEVRISPKDFSSIILSDFRTYADFRTTITKSIQNVFVHLS